ncbi:MAG: HDOD domain-containing protein [Gemmatimonadota bacterium]
MSLISALDPKEMVRQAPNLGSPPAVYQRLVEVLADPRAGSHEVAAIIGQDTSLTARLLRLANSAYFPFTRPVDSVHQAVSMIGATHVRDIALATSVTSVFRAVPPDLISIDEFWRHSVAVGIGARLLAEMRRESNLERHFVAGMLHDVGRLVFYLQAPDDARIILRHAKNHECLLHDAEMELVGFDHGEVGGELMRQWNLPASLIDSVTYHHRPAESGEHIVDACTIHLADLIANALKLGRSGERMVPPRWIGVWDALSLDPAELPDLMTSIGEEFEQVIGAFGFGDG